MSFHIVNASLGGMFVAMTDPPEVGMELNIELDIGRESIMVAGKVTHREIEQPGAAMPSGVGLELLMRSEAWEKVVEGLPALDARRRKPTTRL